MAEGTTEEKGEGQDVIDDPNAEPKKGEGEGGQQDPPEGGSDEGGNEGDDGPKLSFSYVEAGEEKKAEYDLTQLEDGTWDLDDSSKETFRTAFAKGHFQPLYSKEQQAHKKTRQESDAKVREAQERTAKYQAQYGPFSKHIELLKNPENLKVIDKHFTKELAALGYEGTVKFDPNEYERNRLQIEQTRLTWNNETLPNIRLRQREALQKYEPEFTDVEVDSVMSFIQENSHDLEPVLRSDPELGFPNVGNQNPDDLWRALMLVPRIALERMRGQDLIDSKATKDLRKKLKNQGDELDRAQSRVSATSTSAGGSGGGAASKTGKKYDKSANPQKHVANMKKAGLLSGFGIDPD